MIEQFEMKQKEMIKKLVLSGPFAFLFFIYFMIRIINEIHPSNSIIINEIIEIGTIPSIFCVFPLGTFLSNTLHLNKLKKFKDKFNRKYPTGLSYEIFLKKSDLLFPRYKIYIYNSDLFIMNYEYHMISLDAIKTIAFKPVQYRVIHRWFLIITTNKEKVQEIEIPDSMDLNPETLNNELVEPIRIFIRDHYSKIEFKGLVDI